jgi:hypothetical protein
MRERIGRANDAPRADLASAQEEHRARMLAAIRTAPASAPNVTDARRRRRSAKAIQELHHRSESFGLMFVLHRFTALISMPQPATLAASRISHAAMRIRGPNSGGISTVKVSSGMMDMGSAMVLRGSDPDERRGISASTCSCGNKGLIGPAA